MKKFFRFVLCAGLLPAALPGFAGTRVDPNPPDLSNDLHLLAFVARMPEMPTASPGLQEEMARIFEALLTESLRAVCPDVRFPDGAREDFHTRSRIIAAAEALPTTLVNEYWDDLGSAWVNNSRTDFTYDGTDRLIEKMNSFWSDPDWSPSARTTSTYDSSGNLTEDLTDSWNGTMWEMSLRTTGTYDGSGNMLTSVFESWNGSGWDGISRWTMTYDGGNNRLEWVWESWLSGSWVYNSRFLYTYDGSDRLTSFIYQIWNGSGWMDFQKTTSTYDGGGRLATDLVQGWNGSSWTNQTLHTYSYDASDNLIEHLNRTWAGSWMNNSRTGNTYDGSNNLTEVLNQTWNANTWENQSRTSSTYSAGNLDMATTQFWNGSAWANASRDTYTYGTPTTVGEGDLPGGVFRLTANYPNPFNPSTEIGYSVGRRSHVTLSIHDLQGREVSTLIDAVVPAGSYSVRWDARALAAGVYFYRFETDGFRETKKMVLVK